MSFGICHSASMLTESQKRASRAHAERRKAVGEKPITVWLDAEALAALEALCGRVGFGSKREAIKTALMNAIRKALGEVE